MKLTDIQYTRALALARAYGHEWAAHLDFASTLRDPEEIAEHTLAVRAPGAMAGIVAPALEETPDGPKVVHTTMTGRLQWEVWPDGHVNIFIHRPGQGEVIGAWMKPDGSLHAWKADESALYAERHISALETALKALTDDIRAIGDALAVLQPAPLYQYRVVPEDSGGYDAFYVDVPRNQGRDQDRMALGVALIRRPA